MFCTWAHRARRLRSMEAVRASFAEADVRLERSLRYDYVKLKAKGRRERYYRDQYAPPTVPLHASASAAPAAPCLDPTMINDPFAAAPVGGKRSGSFDLSIYSHKR